ncbi:hypothetical protein [Streptosporangium sp. NPDC002607]
MRLLLGLDGPDLSALARAVVGVFGPGWPPDAKFSVDFADEVPGVDWLERFAARQEKGAESAVGWNGDGEPFAFNIGNAIVKAGRDGDWTAESLLEVLEDLPFAVASTGGVHHWTGNGGFADLHYSHGWACAFRGAGHDRLLSRRWLEHGPWRLLTRGDITLVQFHDLAADSETARRQAWPGHELLTAGAGYVSPLPGGARDHPWPKRRSGLRGLYDADTRTLRIVVHGRAVHDAEMRDARLAVLEDSGDPPIAGVAYVFMEEVVARAHLHRLWLHELECWTVSHGREVRLDEDYRPARTPPRWALALT